MRPDAEGPCEIQRQPRPADRAGTGHPATHLRGIKLRAEQAGTKVHPALVGDEARAAVGIDILRDPKAGVVPGQREVQCLDRFRQGSESRIQLCGELLAQPVTLEPACRGMGMHARAHKVVVIVGLLQPEEPRDATVRLVGVRGGGDRLQRKPGEARQGRQPVPVVAGTVNVTDKHPWGHVRRETVAIEDISKHAQPGLALEPEIGRGRQGHVDEAAIAAEAFDKLL